MVVEKMIREGDAREACCWIACMRASPQAGVREKDHLLVQYLTGDEHGTSNVLSHSPRLFIREVTFPTAWSMNLIIPNMVCLLPVVVMAGSRYSTGTSYLRSGV
jgi:hypothetical protein